MTRTVNLMKQLSFVAAFVVPALQLSACVIPIGGAEVGDLRVTWSFNGSQRCSEVGVENVTIQLIEAGKEGEVALAFGQTAECIAGSMVIPDVVAGKYTMTAVGEGEVAIYNNGKGVVVDVVANDESAVEAPLVLVNGQVVAAITYPYTFDGDASCTRAGVATLRAEIYTEDLVFLVSETSDCATGVGTVTNIPLSARRLRVFALDNDNNVLFQSDADPGVVGLQDVALDELQGGQNLRVNIVPLVSALATAEFRYTFGGVQFCGLAGVANVSAQLRDSDGNVITGGGQTVPCVQGNVVFTNIPVGAYDLHIEGTDGNDVVQFSKDVTDLAIDSRAFFRTIDLVALSSQVIVRFVLPEGESCASLGIANVDVRVVDAGGTPLGVGAACVAGEAVLTGPAPGAATIIAEGVSGADIIVSGTDEVLLRPGLNVIPLVLDSVRSLLDISWQFQLEARNDVLEALGAGNPLVRTTTSCRDADVDNVLVSVFRGTVLLEAVVTACDAGRVEIPALPIGGNVTVKLEGLREQEGDSIFETSQTFALAGPRTVRSAVLEPSIVFARVVWAGDCGAAQAATVDVQIRANGVTEAGINVPCAQGTVLIALPRGTEESNVNITLRGVTGQGLPVGAAAQQVTATDPKVTPGINTFRFTGPT